MSDDNTSSPVEPKGIFAGVGILAALGGLLGASCCLLPLALVNLGVSSAVIANLGFFASAYQWFAGAAALLVAGVPVGGSLLCSLWQRFWS